MKAKTIEELRARVAYLEDILDNIPIGIIVADPKGKIMMMNRWQEKISRIKREQVLGTYFHEKWRRLFDQGIMSDYWKLLDEGKPYQSVLHEIYPQYYNEKISAISRGAPLSQGKGVVFLHDVSEEMQRSKRGGKSRSCLLNVLIILITIRRLKNNHVFITGEAKQPYNIFEKGAFQILRTHHIESSQDRELLILKYTVK